MLSEGEAVQAQVNTDHQLRSIDRRTMLAARRQSILQQKQTDSLPKITFDAPGAKAAWRQVMQLREENQRLRAELEELRAEMEQLVKKYSALQAEFDKEVAVVHSGSQQEMEFYQQHLRELQEERNSLQVANAELEHRYQELYNSFQDAVDEEARKMVKDAARTLELSHEEPPLLLQDVARTIELHAQDVENSHLVEVWHLKREVQRMSDLLQEKQQQIEQERQQLLNERNTIREQAQLRHKVIQSHLYARWRASRVLVIAAMLALLVVLQYCAFVLFHVPNMPLIIWLLIGPIVICLIVAGILVQPLSMMRHMYLLSAPHKKKVKKQA